MADFDLRRKLTVAECDGAESLKIRVATSRLGFVHTSVLRFPDETPPPVSYSLLAVEPKTSLREVHDLILAKGFRPATAYELALWSRDGWDQASPILSLAETVEHPMYGTRCPMLFSRGTLKGLGMASSERDDVVFFLMAEDL